ncbi:MAG: RDD family protein [Flavobacterium sp.]
MKQEQKQFKVTNEMLANHQQRFRNFLFDYAGQILLMFLILFVVAVVSIITENKALLVYFEKMNEVAQYTFAMCISLVYYNVWEILVARTPGKYITGTMVVDENGEKPGYQMIMMRSLCRLIPFEILSFFGNPCRGWHDSLSNTYVVDIKLMEEKKQLFYFFENSKSE